MAFPAASARAQPKLPNTEQTPQHEAARGALSLTKVQIQLHKQTHRKRAWNKPPTTNKHSLKASGYDVGVNQEVRFCLSLLILIIVLIIKSSQDGRATTGTQMCSHLRLLSPSPSCTQIPLSNCETDVGYIMTACNQEQGSIIS